MSNPPFITLAEGGIPAEPSSSPSPPSSEGASESSSQIGFSPTSSVSISTHDTFRSKYHIDELSTFAERLENAASSIFPNRGRSRYKKVHVLLLRWEEDRMGVQHELDDLAKTFKLGYGFETETWLIPTVKSYFALTEKALQVVQDFGDSGDLLIVYYAGHGLINDSRKGVWSCRADLKYASVPWHAIQPLFEQADSDVLLLLDCCAAASSAPTDSDSMSVTETIAACGFETWAPQPGRHSFTNSLIAVLEDWRARSTFTAAMLHCEVLQRLRHEKPERYRNTERFEFRRSPIHVFSTNDPHARSIELCPRKRHPSSSTRDEPRCMDTTRGPASSKMTEATFSETNDVHSPTMVVDGRNSPYNMDSLNKVLENGDTALPHVLITLALEEEPDLQLDINQWKRWLQQFPALAKYVRVQGIYKSNSTLLILSVPVVVWDWIPEDPACVFIGYVHSDNLANHSSNQQEVAPSYHPRAYRASRRKPTISKYQASLTSETPELSIDIPKITKLPSPPLSLLKHNHFDNDASKPPSPKLSTLSSKLSTTVDPPPAVFNRRPRPSFSSSSSDTSETQRGLRGGVTESFPKDRQSLDVQNSELWRLLGKREAMVLELHEKRERAVVLELRDMLGAVLDDKHRVMTLEREIDQEKDMDLERAPGGSQRARFQKWYKYIRGNGEGQAKNYGSRAGKDRERTLKVKQKALVDLLDKQEAIITALNILLERAMTPELKDSILSSVATGVNLHHFGSKI